MARVGPFPSHPTGKLVGNHHHSSEAGVHYRPWNMKQATAAEPSFPFWTWLEWYAILLLVPMAIGMVFLLLSGFRI